MFVGPRGVGTTALMKLDCIKGVSGRVKKSLRVLKSFVGALKVAVEGVEFAVDGDGEPGEAVGRTEFRPGGLRMTGRPTEQVRFAVLRGGC